MLTKGQISSFLEFCRRYYGAERHGVATPSLARLLRTTVSTPITFGTLFLTRSLIRYAPAVPTRPAPPLERTEDDLEPPPQEHHLAAHLLEVVAAAYRQSLYHDWLHQKKPSVCRFIPTCTEYAVRAVEKHGLVHGLALTAGRFRRCNPDYHGDYVDFP
jgi:hypothetical protein